MRHFLRLQLRALAGIFKRDLHVFFRYPLDVVFRIFEPLFWIAPVYLMGRGFSVNGQNAGFAAYTGNGDYMAFIILGSVLSSYVSSVFWGIGFSLKRQMDTGVLESNWLTPIPRVTHLIGQTLFNMVCTTFTSLSTAYLAWVTFRFEINFSRIIPAILTAIPVIIAIYGFGFAFAAIVMLMRDANTLVDVGSFLVDVFSGTSFPVTVLPRFLFVIAISFPLTYGYDAIRGMLIGTRTLLPPGQEQLILIIFMAVTVTVGGLVFKWLERRCRQLGTTGMH